MRYPRIIALAAIAVLGLMAFVGAGTASATTFATDAAGTIQYPAGTERHYSLKPGTSGIIEKTDGTPIDTVTEDTIKSKSRNATGTWVEEQIESLTWGSASQTTDTINSGSLEIMQTSGDEGMVVGKGTNVTFGVFGTTCTYGTGEGTTLGTITGGEEAELSINGVVSRTAGNSLLCPSSTRWTTKMRLTSPHALHIVS
jgi:hypothetical protein